MEKLVSVVLPIYNVEEYLERCIESVVNQTYKNLEIILVDDGSPDNCPAICDAWAEKDNRIKVIHKQNAGLGMARNSGLEAAIGDYITFFDSDDYVDLTIIEKILNSAIKHNSDVVIYGRKDVAEDGAITYKPITATAEVYEGSSVQEEVLPSMLTYKMGFGITSCRLYKVSTLRKHDLHFESERKHISEDTRFSIDLFAKDLIVSIVAEGLYYYCVRSGSLSRAFKDDRQKKNDVFLENSLEHIRTLGLPQAVSDHLKVRYHFLTIAAMKHIMKSDLTGKEKKSKLKEIFNSETLRSTLVRKVLSLEKPMLKLFYYTVKFRCYFLSRLLLKIKLAKGS